MDHTFHYFQFLFAYLTLIFAVVQSLSHIQLGAMPWTAACQASLSFTISHSLLRLISIKLVIPSNHLVLCCPFSSCLQSFPASVSFLMSRLFASGKQSFGASASAPVLPMNIYHWFPLGWTDMLAVQGALRVISNTTVQKHQFLGAQPSLRYNSHIHTRPPEKPYMDICRQSDVSAFLYAA